MLKSLFYKNLLTTLLLAIYSSVAQSMESFIFDSTRKAVPIDITTATYNLTFDIKEKRAYVTSTINFKFKEEGYPFFDAVEKPNYIYLNRKKNHSK